MTKDPRPATRDPRPLSDWLSWQETLHPNPIDLGLERVARVLRALHSEPPPFLIITVAGTNGKGSSVAFLDAILSQAGYRVGTYTSPHLLRYNERIRLAGEEVGDAAICAAFERIDAARDGTSLTYFEWATLAAIDLFYRDPPQVAVLEVGMGGRLDAVNVLDPDVALITGVGMDHMRWLGSDRESIAREKAGILRRHRAAVYSHRDVPRALFERATELQASLRVLGRDFDYSVQRDTWDWRGQDGRRASLPMPALRGRFQLDNAAGVLAALAALGDTLPVSQAAVRQGLLCAQLPGRFQVLPGEVSRIFDVAHNPDSAAALSENLANHRADGVTHAVLGMMADKDIEGTLRALAPRIDAWYLGGLDLPRAAAPARLEQALDSLRVTGPRQSHARVAEAYRAAVAAARPGDRIVICGSFYTVAEVLAEAV